MLAQALGASALTAVECEVVTGEALRGSPAAVRSAAREVVKRHSASPAMVNALLEAAPAMAVSMENTDLVEAVTSVRLPALRDRSWRLAARRALVERVIELAAGLGDLGVIDNLSAMLLASYKERLNAFGGNESAAPASGDAALLVLHASAIRVRWEREAERVVASGREPLSLAQIRQHAASRLGISGGVVQEFAAHQLAAFDLMAYFIAADDPVHAPAVAGIADQLAVDRRSARHVLAQIRDAERAIARLWVIRLTGGAS
jgi:hypothetical protein